MGKRERIDFLSAAAEALELPAEVVAGAPVVEIIGRHELHIENHHGILSYAPEEISVSGGKLLVMIRGQGLEIGAMSAGALLITGTIESVGLQ